MILKTFLYGYNGFCVIRHCEEDYIIEAGRLKRYYKLYIRKGDKQR